jgi:hypothetical protein
MKIFNYKSKILVEKTINEEGYSPSKYKSTSNKYIWAVCRFCGSPVRLMRGNYTKANNSACHRSCHMEEMKKQKSPLSEKSTWEKIKKTNLSRYGVEYVSQNAEIAKKISLKRMSNPFVSGILKHFEDVLFIKKHKINKNAFDLFHASKKITLNFNRNLWHSEKFITDTKIARNKHLDKLKLCREKGIRLFQIFEHQWDARSNQVINFIRTILGCNEITVPGRKCEVTNVDAKQFIDDHHIQGKTRSVIKYFNLEYEGEIVASMTASRHHRQNAGENDIVLSRLCFKSNTNVQGGASKLFKHFKEWAKKEGYNRIISWSDNCWTEGNVYRVLDFDLDKEYGPDYFYWDVNKHKYHSKQSQKKKSVGCPDGMTEREWCIERGLFRVWDCGKKKWIFNI